MERDDTISEGTGTTASGYPEGPITCCVVCLSREVHALKDRSWTVGLLISWLTIVLSVVVYLVAFATSGWVRVRKMDESPPREDLVGLWQECIEGKCSYIAQDLTGAGFKASQALAVLCLFCIISGCILTFKYCFSLPSNAGKLGTATLCSRFISFFFLLLLIPVFAMTWDKDHARYSKAIYDGHLAYSFILVAVTFVLEATGAFFIYCEVIVIEPRRKKPLLPRPTDERYDGVINEGYVDITDVGVFPGDVGFSPTEPREPSLADRVVGRLNARTTYEQYAFDHAQMRVDGAGVAGPLCSSGLVPKTAEEIARRFTGVTRAEPEYIPRSSHVINSPGNNVAIPNTVIEEPSDELYEVIPVARPVQQSVSMQNVFNEDVARPVQQSISMQNVYNEAVARPVQQSISMQNVFNEDVLLARSNVDGRLVTSVSMYNISDDLPEIVYDRETEGRCQDDQLSTRSWHRELNDIQESSDTFASSERHYENVMDNPEDGSARRNEVATREPRPRRSRRKTPVERRANSKHLDNSATKGTRQTTNDVKDKSQAGTQPAYKKKRRKQQGQRDHVYTELDFNQSRQTKDSLETSARDNKTIDGHHRMVDKMNVSSQNRGLLHGQSLTSLHSVISSGSTSIVGGCAETEI